MNYLMKLTQTGAAKLAAAEAGGQAVSLTEIAIGDGNGNPVNLPTGVETTLVREVYRDQIAALYTNPNDDSIFIAEMTIPSVEGGWVMREIGVFDTDGDLFAYGNFPETYKATITEGTAREIVVVAAVKVSSTENIQLLINGDIVLASRDWVLNTISAGYLLPGGTTDQVLAKASNADGDTYWMDIGEGIPVLIGIIKERQVLAQDQTVINFNTVSTKGLAVFIEGLRKIEGIHYSITSDTSIELSTAYPAGSNLHVYQNDPNGQPEYLKPHLNLSDVSSTAESRKNLRVFSKIETYFLAQI